MVTTHREMEKKKKMPIYVKEPCPARKFMSYDEAVEHNKKLKEDREKILAYAEKLKAEKSSVALPGFQELPEDTRIPGGVEDESIVKTDGLDERQFKKVERLQEEKRKQRGPGAKERKAKIQAEIEKILAGS